MEYIVKDLGSYKLHLIKNTKFKAIRTKVFFNAPIKKDEITIRVFLAAMLYLTNEKYKTRRSFALKCEDLYACSIGYRISRFGNYSNFYFGMNALEDRFSEENNLEKCFELLSDIIYKPNVVNNEFDEVYFNIVKNDILTNINSIKESPSNYSVIRLLENMDVDSPLSYRPMGYVEDLEKITRGNLYDYYQRVLNNDIMDIFVIGNIDFVEIEKLVRKYFPPKVFKKITIGCRLEEERARSKVQIIKEENDTNQSKFALGCRLNGLTDYERNYALTLYSIILGGGSNSKLFKEVREKNSLAYYIHSTPNKLDNLLLIRAGISKDNFLEVIDLVKLQMNEMKKGKITDLEIENAKKMYLSSIDEIEESQDEIIDSYYMMDLLGVDDIETKKKKMMEVTKKEIISVSKKVHIDTIYLLEGVKE